MKTFSFPNTASCRVVYNRDGTTYSGTMTTPKTQQELLVSMSARNAKVDDIISIEAVEPKAEFIHTHPFAPHRMAKIAATNDQ